MKCPCCGQTIIKPEAPKKKRHTMSQILSMYPEEQEEGYRSGLTWDASWYPGGPADNEKNKAYMSGFYKGLAQRLKTNKRFAKWWDAQRKSSGNYSRYTEENESGQGHTV